MALNPLIAPQCLATTRLSARLDRKVIFPVKKRPWSWGAAKAGTPRPGRGRWASQVYSLMEGAAKATATGTTAPHSQFYHPLSFLQRGPVLIGEDEHVAPPSVGPRDGPEQQDQSWQGNQETPQVRHVSRSPSIKRAPTPPPRRSSTSALAAAPLMRTTSQRGARHPLPLPASSNSVRMSGT